MSKFGEKIENFLEYLIPVFALLGDLIVVYALCFFARMHYDWYWFLVLLGICIPILIPFNKYGYQMVRSWFGKKGK